LPAVSQLLDTLSCQFADSARLQRSSETSWIAWMFQMPVKVFPTSPSHMDPQVSD